ncbi:hypothetical protein [Pseudonocardia sp. D17]|uniref:hypothetical protein n=1 Tax=Pseudonocardia sp. D17 TaxID=882661 RepID=UPI002B39A08A|nr:hypothetical protein PSD17_28110 [Pseudonocardia sp. D17]
MDEQLLVETRRSLHAVAELVVAGPQHRAAGTIRLRVTPGGFGGVATPMRVVGTELRWDGGQAPLAGTCRELARAAGVEVGAPVGLYADGSGVGPDRPLTVDAAAAEVLADWFARGDEALRSLAPGAEPVIWPEHFDLGVTLDEVNYGVSPGDAQVPAPYAYVGPWRPRHGEFWNAPFGALRTADELPDAEAVAAFFAEGRRLAAGL